MEAASSNSTTSKLFMPEAAQIDSCAGSSLAGVDQQSPTIKAEKVSDQPQVDQEPKSSMCDASLAQTEVKLNSSKQLWHDVQEKIQEFKDLVATSGYSIPTDQLGTVVKTLSAQKVFRGERNLFSCEACCRVFETRGIHNRHAKKCRLPTATHVWHKKGELYPCDICGESYKNMHFIKKHFYDAHTDIEAEAFYRRDLENLVGSSYMKRLRQATFTHVAAGTIDNVVQELLGAKLPADFAKVSRVYPVYNDVDENRGTLRLKIMVIRR
jgi:hypothetical protein